MAARQKKTLTREELAEHRHRLSEARQYGMDVSTWTEPNVSAGMQQVEDWYDRQQTPLRSQVRASLRPSVMTDDEVDTVIASVLFDIVVRERERLEIDNG